jgi:Protein of unknown function (DUF3108)
MSARVALLPPAGERRTGDPRLKYDPSRPVQAACAAIVAALALFFLHCDLADAQSTLTARYKIALAGVEIGAGDWSVDIDKDRYVAKSSGQLFGIWRVLLGPEISATTHGTATPGHLAPTSYVANFSSDDAIDDVRMVLRDGLVSEVEAKPPIPASLDRVPVTAADLRGAMDPLTAGLVPVLGTGDVLAPAACQRTLPIFDGTHRFDMALSFKRLDMIKAEAGYQGPGVVCGMTYRPIAGYNTGAFRINYLKNARDMEMWLAPIAGTRLLAMFRISIPTMLGLAVLGATRFESAVR